MIRYDFCYAHVELFSESDNPQFLYGGILEGDNFEFHDNFADFWASLVKARKHRKVVFFHDLDVTLSTLQYHARKDLGYSYNPYKKGQKHSIYKGQFAEVYADDHRSPTIFADLKQYENSPLKDLAELFGVPLGVRESVDRFMDATMDDKERVMTSCVIIKETCETYGYDNAFKVGQLTTSSISQGEIRRKQARLKGSTYNPSFKLKFGANKDKLDYPIPYSCVNEIEKRVEEMRENETVRNEHDDSFLYGINRHVEKEYRLKLKRYWVKQYEKEDKTFKKRQREVHKKIALEDYSEDVYDFLAMDLPDGESPTADKIVDRHSMDRIIEEMNKIISPNLLGGVTYLVWTHQGKIIGGDYGGAVLDMNSIYAHVILKYDLPHTYIGSTIELDPNKAKFYVAEVKKLSATCKEGRFPMLRRGGKYNSVKDFGYNEVINWKAEKGKPTILLNTADIELLYENYDVEHVEFGEVFYYNPDDFFTESIREHVRYWQEKKENAKTKIERQIAKNMLNMLWGRWSMYEKIVDHGGREKDVGDKHTNMVTGCFVTSLARRLLSSMMTKVGERLIYADTDSVHIFFDEKCRNIEELKGLIGDVIDPKEFGKWKVERLWRRAVYHANKIYALELEDGTVKVTCSGLKNVHIDKLEEFYKGKKFPNNIYVEDEEGRRVLTTEHFTI